MDTEHRLGAWILFLAYTAGMIGLGALGMRRVRSSDDFATARGGYGPLFLALAFTATTASGATFLGIPALVYEVGLPGLWYAFIYPVGVYAGVLLTMRAVVREGARFGSRSIPEFLGDRYRSEALRVGIALFSSMLLFYLAGQMVAGLVMFDRVLGLPPGQALLLTGLIMGVYVSLGGAHADILTDGLQGLLMLLLAGGAAVLFFSGFGAEGGFSGMLARVEALQPGAVGFLAPGNPLVGSWWAVLAIALAHLPLGMLPHIGNKLWALRQGGGEKRFVCFAFAFGMLLPAIALAGFGARAVLGDELLGSAGSPNEAVPALFAALFPPWMSALLGVAVLAAVMSTADGLVVSISQIFANDLYRRTLAPRLGHSPERVERLTLWLSRWGAVAALGGAMALGWWLREVNIALLVWIGVGGLMAALAGPLVVGLVWPGATARGALASALAGGAVFILLKASSLPLAANPFACAALGEAAGIAVMVLVCLGERQSMALPFGGSRERKGVAGR